MRQNLEVPAVQSVSDVKASDRFVDFWKCIGIQQLIPNSGFSQVPYGLYCPSLKAKVETAYANNVLSNIRVLRHASVTDKMVEA